MVKFRVHILKTNYIDIVKQTQILLQEKLVICRIQTIILISAVRCTNLTKHAKLAFIADSNNILSRRYKFFYIQVPIGFNYVKFEIVNEMLLVKSLFNLFAGSGC